MESCPDCGRPYGKRRRCYYCKPGKKKTGETAVCRQCGDEFYIQKNQLAHGEGKFCSYRCKYEWYRDRPGARREEDRSIEHSGGYLLAWVGHDHPYNSRGRILEHRYVIEQKIGRYLEPHEHVHHINGDKRDNRPENLQVVANEEHALLHKAEKPKPKRVAVECQECGKSFEVIPSRVNSEDAKIQRKYCSLDCRHKSWGRQMVEIRKAKDK